MHSGSKTPLQYKIAANYQRREREVYLRGLSANLRSALETARYITSPELDGLLRYFFVTPDGLAGKLHPAGFHYGEFGNRQSLIAALDAFGDRHDAQPAYLRPHGTLPAFEVEFGWARQHIARLFESSPYGLALTTRSFNAGIVIDHYVGNLPNEPTPEEVVFELGTWH